MPGASPGIEANRLALLLAVCIAMRGTLGDQDVFLNVVGARVAETASDLAVLATVSSFRSQSLPGSLIVPGGRAWRGAPYPRAGALAGGGEARIY